MRRRIVGRREREGERERERESENKQHFAVNVGQDRDEGGLLYTGYVCTTRIQEQHRAKKTRRCECVAHVMLG